MTRKFKKSKKTKSEDWKKRLMAETNVSEDDLKETMFADWTWEKMEYIMRKVWWSIIQDAKDNKYKVNNIVSIMGKDTRKTTVWVIFVWFLMTQYDWLNGFLLRDTILKSQTQVRMQVRKAITLVNNEYDVKDFSKHISESNTGFYLVRDKYSKSNQLIDLLSFDSIIELGGFTTNNGYPAIFLYDELQNPNSANKKIMEAKQFLANYKFIAKKNKGISISSGKKLPDWIPEHIFLSNRYVGNHPLNLFAEAHLPYYDTNTTDTDGITKREKGIRSWMLDDPLNNNFIAKYFGKEDMQEGWEDLWGTYIIYGGPLSNEILRLDKEWEQEQLERIENGAPEDLAYIIGDLFEGYDGSDGTYRYTRKDTITLEEFKKDYAPYVEDVRISMDIDFRRQLVLGAHYDVKKFAQRVNGSNVFKYRTIRDVKRKILCDGKLAINGETTEKYIKQLQNEIFKYIKRIKEIIPNWNKKIRLIIDDKNTLLVGRFNFSDYKHPIYHAIKVYFNKLWPIIDRPAVIDEMQDTGFVIDIKDPTNTELHQSASITKSEKVYLERKGGWREKRLEKDNDPIIDTLNEDEYGLYHARPKMAWNQVATRLLGKNEW